MLLRALKAVSRASIAQRIVTTPQLQYITSRYSYATSVKAVLPNLPTLLTDLKNQSVEKSQPSVDTLKSIECLLEKETIKPQQALEILTCCRNAIGNKGQREAVESIWFKLKESMCGLSEQHYITMMEFYKNTGDADGILKTFKEVKEIKKKPSPLAYRIIFDHFCEEGNSAEAAEWWNEIINSGYYLNEISYNRLIQYYVKAKDIETANIIMQKLEEKKYSVNFHTLSEFLNYHAENGDFANVKKTLDTFTEKNIEFRNKVVVAAIMNLSSEDGHVEELLGYLKQDSYTFSKSIITQFVENGQPHIVPKILSKIAKSLGAPSKFLITEMERLGVTPNQFNRTIDGLKALGVEIKIQNDKESGAQETHAIPKVINVYNTMDTEESRFYIFIHERNIAEMEALVARGTLQMNGCRNSLLIKFYADVKNLDKALNTLKKVRANDKSFVLDFEGNAKLLKLMVKENRSSNEMVDLIKTNRQDESKYRLFVFEDLFDSLAAAGNDELLNKLYKPTVDNNYFEETPNSIAPLIRVHLTKGDFKQAIDVYEKYIKDKDLSSSTSRLMTTLTKNNEWELLQRVYDVYAAARGQSMASYRLAFAFIECGLSEKAAKIFNSKRIDKLAGKISRISRDDERLKKTETLKCLLDATKGIKCDRHLMYRRLLQIYCEEQQWDEALNLWKQHEDDEVKPSREFLDRLKTSLESHEQVVPRELKFNDNTEP